MSVLKLRFQIIIKNNLKLLGFTNSKNRFLLEVDFIGSQDQILNFYICMYITYLYNIKIQKMRV
jgi:hypothetical protein